VIDPGGSGGGFDDVQDLHEARVVVMRLLLNALKTIPQNGASAQRAKLQAVNSKMSGADGTGSAGKLIDNWRRWCYI
jgi:hypothetical protein